MSDHKTAPRQGSRRPFAFPDHAPDGPNEKGSSVTETIWEPFQKEAEYKTPKKP